MNNFESKPLYRFFNVIFTIAYFFAFLFILLAGYIGYSTHELSNATVHCRDGTSWNAKEIHNDYYALCGICTKRSADGVKYTECELGHVDFDSFNVEEEYSWSWNTVLFPIIAFFIFFGIVDFLKIAFVYIFSGKVNLKKGVVIKFLSYIFN